MSHCPPSLPRRRESSVVHSVATCNQSRWVPAFAGTTINERRTRRSPDGRELPLPGHRRRHSRRVVRHRTRRARRLHRTFRLRQDDAAEADRRLPCAPIGPRRHRRRRRHGDERAVASMRHRVPVVRAVPAHERSRQRRVSVACARCAACRASAQRRRDARARRALGAGRPPAGATVRRPAAARSTRPRASRCATSCVASSDSRTSRRF